MEAMISACIILHPFCLRCAISPPPPTAKKTRSCPSAYQVLRSYLFSYNRKRLLIHALAMHLSPWLTMVHMCTAHDGWNTALTFPPSPHPHPRGNMFCFLDRVKSPVLSVWTTAGTGFWLMYRQLITGNRVWREWGKEEWSRRLWDGG